MRTVRSSSSHRRHRICLTIRMLRDRTVNSNDNVLVTMRPRRIVAWDTTTPTSPQTTSAARWAASSDGRVRFTSSDVRTWRPVSGAGSWCLIVAAVLLADQQTASYRIRTATPYHSDDVGSLAPGHHDDGTVFRGSVCTAAHRRRPEANYGALKAPTTRVNTDHLFLFLLPFISLDIYM